MIDGAPAPTQLVDHASVSVARQLVLDAADQFGQALVRQAERLRGRAVVVAAPREVDHFAPPSDGAAFGPLTIEDVALLLTRRRDGVFLRRSSSIVSWPTLRSSAAILAS